MKRKVLSVFAVAAAALVLNGCVVALGNRGTDLDRKASVPTLGKQLTDLKQARDSGALTEEEYQVAKKRLIDGK